MPVLARRSSDIRITEVDLSTTITQNATVTAVFLVVSNQGSTDVKLMTNGDDALFEYNNPNARMSFDHYAFLDYFAEGNLAYCKRVVGSGAKYSTAIAKVTAGGATVIAPITSGLVNPKEPDWNALVGAGETPLFLLYGSRGPGSYANNHGFTIQSDNLEAPTGLTVGSSITGGTLTAATYTYSVAAISRNGETLATTPVTIIIGSATTTNTANLSWNAVPNAIGYKVYGRVGPTLGFVAQVGATTTTFVDDGSYTIDNSKNPITSPSALPAPSTNFILKMFDTDVNRSTPLESFQVSMFDQTDETGVQMEIEQRVNRFSKYFRVVSNLPALLTVPTVRSTSTIVNLAGGDSGSAPTSANINAGWDAFKNKEKYKVDVLVNAGRTDVAVQRKMDALAQQRFDCVSFLDLPAGAQTAQSAVDFRNLDLNLNSSYSALFCSDLQEMDPISGKVLYVPPSGAMAGLLARTTRIAQPWFSMAGLNRGLLNALDVRETYDDGEATLLYQSQVNYMRKFIGQGIPLWEQQTLYAKSSALQFLNVRVLCNVIKRSVYQFLIYGLQEPGDDILSRQLKFGLEDYLRTVQNARGIKSFRVIITPTNNPPALVNSGILNIGVYIVPILAVHEIALSLLIGKDQLEITEQGLASLS